MYETFKQRRFDKISVLGQGIYAAAFKHLKPLLDHKIKSLKTYQFQTLIDNLDRKHQTKENIKVLLSQIIDITIELYIRTKNYAKFIELGVKEKSDKHKSFTTEDINLIYENVEKVEFLDIALILICTGMRTNELFKLKKGDVHLDQRFMTGGSNTEAGQTELSQSIKRYCHI